MPEGDLDAVVRALPLLPVAALVFADGRVTAANEPAVDILETPLDGLVEGFAGHLRDHASRVAFERLLAGGEADSSPVMLKWGTAMPARSLSASARRIDDRHVLVVLVGDDEAQRLDGIMTAFHMGMVMADEKRRAVWMSRGTVDTYGTLYPLGTDVLDSVHPDDRPRLAEGFETALAHPRRMIRDSVRASHADFPDVWWQLDLVTVNLLDDPAVGGVVTAFGPHADAPSDLDGDGDGDADRISTNRMSDIMPAGIVQAMANGDCYYRNRLAQQHLGDIPLRQRATGWIDRVRDVDRPALREAAARALAGERSSPVVIAVPAAGGVSWYRIEFTPQFTDSGQPAGWMATSLDVTAEVEAREELQRAQDHLWHLANHDALTGLPNRPAMMDRIEAALSRNQRDGRSVAALYCDLDGFKPVNDRYGHEAGDTVLLVVGQRMLAAVRASDAVGRIGGDEFVVLCESFDSIDELMSIADRVERSVSMPISVGAPPVSVSVGVTVGVAVARPGESSDSLLSRADAAMYDRKVHR